jgi:type I restriction enzyme M protein
VDELQATLWKAADTLRGSMDAAHYKDFVLGLVFLRHAAGDAPWARLAAAARAGGSGLGRLLDAAMAEATRARPALAGVFPLAFATVDERRLAGLVTLIGDLALAAPPGGGPSEGRDVLGEAYEYLLEKFARAEGRRGGEFYTPASVVRLLVEVLQPYHGTVYDPCCGSGGMFVQAGKFVLAHQGRPGDLVICGQESNERTWRLARMNLAIHAVAGDLGPGPADTLHQDLHPAARADFILANPPFNMSDWARDPADARWRFGLPPRGNANFAWLQHIVAKLAPGGTAGVVLANGSMSARQGGEGAIRRALVEADLVACMVALPPQLFRSTQIPACVWFLSKDKGSRRGEILFIDARSLGDLATRTERVLSPLAIARIAGTYHAWRQAPPTAPGHAGAPGYADVPGRAGAPGYGDVPGHAGAPGYGDVPGHADLPGCAGVPGCVDVPGFCYAAPLAEVRAGGHVLIPGLYVGAPRPPADAEPPADRVARLTEELYENFAESARLADAVRAQLGSLPADAARVPAGEDPGQPLPPV